MNHLKFPAISVKGIHKKFGKVKALDGLDMEISQGMIYGFLGPNGSGKSTTIRILLSLAAKDSGSVEIFGLPVEKHRKRILPKVGALIERPDFYEHLSALTNLKLLQKYSGIAPDLKNIFETLETVGLGGRSQDKVRTYSDGMKQRLGIAQAIMHKPELLILDEPFNSLDPQGVKDVRELILRLNNESGMTVLVSSHNLDEVEKLAGSMVLINKGKAVAEGKVAHLMKKGRARLRLIVDNMEKALNIIRQSELGIEKPVQAGSKILLSCKRDDIPALNKLLTEQGISFRTVRQQFAGGLFLFFYGKMMRILSIELYKIFNRKRSYIGFAAVLALVLLVAVTFYFEGTELLGFVMKNLEDTFEIRGNIMNGNMFAYVVLKSLWVHFPILVALVTGDLVSGEEQSGTFRLILTRPVGRISLITAKFAAALVYVSALVLFMALLSLGLGYTIFGPGDLIVLMNKVNIFTSGDILWRLTMGYLFGILSMGTIAALSVFLSAVTRSSLAAILGTIAIVIVMTFVSLINAPVINWIKPLLFTTYSSSWQTFFEYGFQLAPVLRDGVVLVLYMAGFYVATALIFKRKDILS